MLDIVRKWKDRQRHRREARQLDRLIWHLRGLSPTEMCEMLAMTHHVAYLVQLDYDFSLWTPRDLIERRPDYVEMLCRRYRHFDLGKRVNPSHAVQIWKYTILGIADPDFYHPACEIWNHLGRGAAGVNSTRLGFYVDDPRRVPAGLMVNW